ncbi:MAG TPA: Holliday junction branch migration protein RuvA [Candidatus Binataceae bacterium]
MIATISGTLRTRDAGRVVVETAGVGYEIAVPLSTYYRLPAIGAPVALEIRQVVREDAILLYGFSEPSEKRAFDLLMQVQHVGPKLALAILSVLAPEELAAAITREDVHRIDAVPGVGPKVAERVVRELRDKIGELKLAPAGALAANGAARTGAAGNIVSSLLDDAISALVNLGVKPAEARRAVDSVVAEDSAAAANLELTIRKSLAVLLGEK